MGINKIINNNIPSKEQKQNNNIRSDSKKNTIFTNNTNSNKKDNKLNKQWNYSINTKCSNNNILKCNEEYNNYKQQLDHILQNTPLQVDCTNVFSAKFNSIAIRL